MQASDIVFVSLDPTVGHEQRGRRPVIVVSRFNPPGSSMRIVAPITTGGGAASLRGFLYPLPDGLRTVGVVLCHQLRCLDLTARDAELRESVSAHVLAGVMMRVLAMFGRPPALG